MGNDPPHGLYWVRPKNSAEVNYSLYLLLPSDQEVEYGILTFDAYAVAAC